MCFRRETAFLLMKKFPPAWADRHSYFCHFSHDSIRTESRSSVAIGTVTERVEDLKFDIVINGPDRAIGHGDVKPTSVC